MDIVAIIISIVALVGAGFAFIRASSSHHILGKRIEDLKERVKYLEASQNRGQSAQGNRNKQTIEQADTGRRNQPKQEPQESRQRQEQQDVRQNQPREEREPRQKQQRQEQRQKKRDRQQELPEEMQATDETAQHQQPRRRKDNRRRNETIERPAGEHMQEQPIAPADGITFEVVGSHLLDEIEEIPVVEQYTPTQEPELQVADSGIRFAIIPEDGVIRQYQLQQRPDSDSYIEIDVPAEGSNQTRYRFNLSGNHAFVISQGIDRLENAFDFEKPSNRMVTKVVQQQDGVLAKVNNGWRIQEKARIDFR